MKLFRYLFLLAGFWSNGLFSQQLKFETFDTRNGLSSNEITCVYEDHNHFLWVGTRDGLNCFDGRVFKVFRNNPANSNSLSGNYVVGLTQDEKHIYWIATKDGGLTRYDANAPAGSEFLQFKSDPRNSKSIATNRLNCVCNWDENYLAIGAEVVPGIFLNKKTLEFTYWNYDSIGFHPRLAAKKAGGKTTWIHYMIQNGDKFYFSILNFGQVFEVNKQTGKFRNISCYESIYRFMLADNKLWMGGWGPELNVAENKPGAEVERWLGFNDELTCITDINRTFLLTGTRSSGLFLVNKKTRQLIPFKRDILQSSSIPSNRITALFKDSRGIVWVGTLKGLAKYDVKTWLFTEQEFTDVQYDGATLYTHRFTDGSVAVNTAKGMFLSDELQMEFKNIHFTKYGNELVPDCILPLDDEDFLLGTENGFFRWKKGSNSVSELSVQYPGFYKQGIYQVKEMIYDSLQGLHGAWMAVLGYGLSFYSFDDGTFYTYLRNNKYPKSIGSSLARRLDKDKNGNIWIATASGLYKRSPRTPFSENSFEAFVNDPNNPGSLPSNDVTDVWCSRDNHVWVTMGGGGLAEFDGTRFIQYVPESQVSSRVFLGMHIDKRNRIWITTKNGLEVFDRSSKKFYHLDVNDGSANSSISTYFSNETEGKVSFTAGNKLYTFKPDKIEFSTAFPPLYLTDMNVFGKSFWTDVLHGVTHLNSRERYVNFTVSALQFTSPQMVRFQYKLEGLEDNWSNSPDGEIKYTNLPWGHYKLRVRVTNPAGQYGGEKVLAEFVIATPFYYTWWFIALCFIALAILTYGFYRYRISQLMKLQAIRNKIARDLHDDIGSTLGSISVFSEAARQLLEQNKAERAQNMLGKIGDTSREMIDNMSDIVWSVNPKNDSARHLIERMRVFAGDLVASSEIQLIFNAQPGVEDIKLTMEQRKNIFLIFKETVYNTVKYADGKTLTVDIKRSHKSLLFTISDNGRGFDVDNYTSKNGNGIKNMKFRAEEIGAIYQIESSAMGTTTTIKVL
jgi:signal transduction histidine kinase/ligand-binding sensor domain-containing protein